MKLKLNYRIIVYKTHNALEAQQFSRYSLLDSIDRQLDIGINGALTQVKNSMTQTLFNF